MAFGLGPMGCIPLQRVLSSSGDCQDRTNNLALSFNKAASSLLDGLATRLPNATYKFGDAYDVVADVISNPGKYGMENKKQKQETNRITKRFDIFKRKWTLFVLCRV